MKRDNTKDLLGDIISWEKDLSEYEALETILRELYDIRKKAHYNENVKKYKSLKNKKTEKKYYPVDFVEFCIIEIHEDEREETKYIYCHHNYDKGFIYFDSLDELYQYWKTKVLKQRK